MKDRRSRNDRWCSCERSIEVNTQWTEKHFWPEWHFRSQSAAQSEEGIGDVGNSALAIEEGFTQRSGASISHRRIIIMTDRS